MEHQDDIKMYCVVKWDLQGVWTEFMRFRKVENGVMNLRVM